MNAVYTFTDHIGGETIVHKVVANDFDTEADALSMYSQIEQQLADNEIAEAIGGTEQGVNPEKVPDHQSQADYDRRVLGYMMTVEDAHSFLVAYPMFQAMEIRGGANAGQRATYLGVNGTEYGELDDRFGNVNGVSWFLADEKEQIWDSVPDDWA